MITVIHEHEFEDKTVPMTPAELEEWGGYPLVSLYVEISGDPILDAYSDDRGSFGPEHICGIHGLEWSFHSDEECENELSMKNVPKEVKEYFEYEAAQILIAEGE